MAIVIVLVSEMLNTAIEVTIDMISETYHPRAKIAKDIAAGVVLVASTGALALAYLILYPALKRSLPAGYGASRKLPMMWYFVALAVVVIVVIIIKAFLVRASPPGGMPSGHAAVSVLHLGRRALSDVFGARCGADVYPRRHGELEQMVRAFTGPAK